MTIMINPFIPFGPGILRSGDLVRNYRTGQEKLGGDYIDSLNPGKQPGETVI